MTELGTRLAALFALGTLTLAASPALAYCQTTLCANDTSGVTCAPAQAGDCGTPMRWHQGCFGYAIAQRASERVPYDSLAKAMAAAAAAWMGSDCGAGAEPGLAIIDLGAIACDQKEYNQMSGNANIVLVHDAAWPYSGAGNTLALTTVTFDLDSGAIFDADLELNGTLALSTSDTDVQFDLESIVTHEVGHMLGLAHSEAPESTMVIAYQAGDTQLRTLAADDQSGVCETYPPADVSACDPTPRRGFATVCDPPPPEEGGCDCSTAAPAGMPARGLSVLALVGCILGRRVWRQ